MPIPAIDSTINRLFTGDPSIAADLREPLQSYREFMSRRFTPTDFCHEEVAALERYLIIINYNLDDASPDWQVAMAVCLARFHRRSQEESERVTVIAEQVATRVAEWYCGRQGFTFLPRRRFKRVCGRLKELTVTTYAAVVIADSR